MRWDLYCGWVMLLFEVGFVLWLSNEVGFALWLNNVVMYYDCRLRPALDVWWWTVSWIPRASDGRWSCCWLETLIIHWIVQYHKPYSKIMICSTNLKLVCTCILAQSKHLCFVATCIFYIMEQKICFSNMFWKSPRHVKY